MMKDKKIEQTADEQFIKDDRHRLILVTDWNKYFDYPTIGGLRALIFNAKSNGFNRVIRRINSRILINVEAYYQWVEDTNKCG